MIMIPSIVSLTTRKDKSFGRVRVSIPGSAAIKHPSLSHPCPKKRFGLVVDIFMHES